MDDQDWPDLDKPTFNAKEVLRWIEGQSPDRQIESGPQNPKQSPRGTRMSLLTQG